MDNLNIRNIGILAHVDAGKTTLTEYLLYKSGTIKNPGSVDRGTAHTDNMEVEQQRGISVKAAEASFTWKGIDIHIIDTPGHIDFSAEVERSLGILDGAVMVISAVEGVQPQTEVYFNTLKAMKIPTIFFINKIDRIGVNIDRILKEIEKMLTVDAAPFQIVNGEETLNPDIETLEFDDENFIKNEKTIDIYNRLIEHCADKDEEILEKYLNGEKIGLNELNEEIKKLVKECQLYPVFYGAALRGIGVEEMLEALVEYLPPPNGSISDKLSGIVFKIQHHKAMGKAAYVRLYSGHIQNREMVLNFTKGIEEKVNQIKKLSGQKEIDANIVKAGEIACVAGLSSASIGDILGNDELVPKTSKIATPLLTVRVYPKHAEQYVELLEALMELEEEDPLLKLQVVKEKKELNIQVMGMIQLEIIETILRDRFNIEGNFGRPSVIYKETPKSSGYGFAAYTMPKPCWAIVRFYIEPLGRGEGVIYESRVRTEDIKLRYQREIEKQLPKALEEGVYGWEVMDLKITLVEGEDHVMHSNPGDFLIATSMGIMDGLSSIGTTLLEPMINYRISVPEDIGGKVLGDMVQMRGTFDSPTIINGKFTVEGEVPVSTSLEYPVRLGILSSGRGVISTKFSGYKECPIELGAVKERQGVNPLDRAKFILYMRNALD